MNLEILKKLNSKSKPNFSEISEELDLSRTTIQNKLEKLFKNKVIKDYTININPNINPSLKYVFLEIKTNPNEPLLVEQLLEIPQLKVLDGIFGEFSLMALFIFKNSNDFNEVLNHIDSIMANSCFKKYQLIETIRVFKTNGITLNNFEINPNYELDDFDHLILQILQNEQGFKLISTYEMKQMMDKDISQSTIYNKVKKLEENGIILNYTINFCPKKIGFNGKFLVRIKPKDPSKYDEIAMNLAKRHEIINLFRIGEQYGLFATVRVKNIEDYSSFIRNLYQTEEIEDTYTNFVLDELKPYTNFIIY
ncbi:MAG: Lrp/AsnC family transcriptional regulator [Promethearchaeota archaeon]|nr:MAG: Lrp/AsnC family transcriptional regulator [Candidatus Lokiarchaeota archaeon]